MGARDEKAAKPERRGAGDPALWVLAVTRVAPRPVDDSHRIHRDDHPELLLRDSAHGDHTRVAGGDAAMVGHTATAIPVGHVAFCAGRAQTFASHKGSARTGLDG